MYHGNAKSEQTIARRVLRRILSEGFKVRVWDEEGPATEGFTTSEATAWDAMGETGMTSLSVHGADGRRVGSVLLVWGNGEDLVSDFSWNEAYPDSEAIMGRLAA